MDLQEQNWKELTVKDATHFLRCRQAFGRNGRDYTMLCKPLKNMPDGKMKIVVFGERQWNGKDHLKRLRYVHSSKLIVK